MLPCLCQVQLIPKHWSRQPILVWTLIYLLMIVMCGGRKGALCSTRSIGKNITMSFQPDFSLKNNNVQYILQRRVRRNALVQHFNSAHMRYDPQQSIYYVQKKPRIVRPPQSVATIVGQSVLFVCLVEGNPAPKVQWKVSGADVSEARFGKTVRAPRGSVLRITNALPSHNGAVVTCTATNALGRAEQDANLVVYADERVAPSGYPKFLNSFSVIVAKKNAGVELECRASGDPQPEIDWFKNSVPIDLTNPRFEKLSEGNLRISNLVEEDEGKYECAASNDKGTRLSSGDNLLVRENVETSLQLIAPSTKRFRPHFTHIPASRQIVPPGGRLALSCTAVGAPVPNVDWYRGTRRLHRERLDQQPPGTARILLLDLSESINVTCVAESPMGRIYHEVQVIVKMLPGAPGRPYLADLGATFARLAFEPSATKSVNSSVTNYILFWIASVHFTNETLHANSQDLLTALHNPSGSAHDSAFPLQNEDKPLRFTILPTDKTMIVKLDDYQVKVVESLSPSESVTSSSNSYGAILSLVSQLKPFTEYMAWARAVGPDGDTSLPGPVLSFTTHEIAPTSPPRNVHAQAISNAAVTVYWDPPIEANGRIRAYRVHYTDRPNLELPFWDASIMNVNDAPSVPASQTFGGSSASTSQTGRSTSGHLFILTHLLADTTYYIRVSAVNGKGEGPASDTSVVIVRPGLLSQPQNLTATVQSSQDVELTWETPADMDQSLRPLKHYHLLYAPTSLVKTSEKPKWAIYLDSKDPQVEQREVEPSLRRILISGLRADTNYLFNLASVSGSGSGVPAVAYGRTKRFVPAAPTELTVEAISPTDLEVRWRSPPRDSLSHQTDSASTRIAYYDLSWRPSTNAGGWLRSDHAVSSWASSHGSSSQLVVQPDANGFSRRIVPVQPDNETTEVYSSRIGSLQPGTYYVVHVRAVAPSGPGDRAVSGAVKTWDPPPPAPRNLRLSSQIISPTGRDMPPLVAIHASWEEPLIQTTTDSVDGEVTVGRNETVYQIKWRLMLGSSDKPTHDSNPRRRLRHAAFTEWSLFWQRQESQKDQLTSVRDLIPATLTGGRLNTTGTRWNPPPGQFLLGMTYEIKVAIVTPVQLGQEAVELIAIEGAAPTAAPTGLALVDEAERPYLVWKPPDWSHRHGTFVAYEVKCQASNISASNANGSFRNINLTLDNSDVQWPGQLRLDSDSLIVWPQARIVLKSLVPSEATEAGSRDSRIFCSLRGQTNYGFSPWSSITLNVPKKSATPSAPKEIRAILLTSGELRVSWAMPTDLLQTLNPKSEMWIANQSTPFIQIPNQDSYRQFAVYVSAGKTKNWTRHLTNGPVSEAIVTNCDPQQEYVVRVSAINRLNHEGTWSEVVRAELTSPGSEIQVHNLSCSALYAMQIGRWGLKLAWHTPQRLMTGMHVGRLLHYRVNYTRDQDPLSRESSVRVKNTLSPSGFIEHSIDGLQSGSAYTVSVRPVLKSISVSNQNQLTTDLYGVPVTVRCTIPVGETFTVQPPWLIGHTNSPRGLVIGCLLFNHTSLERPIYELVALQLDSNGGVLGDKVEYLARWIVENQRSAPTGNAVHVQLTGKRRTAVDVAIVRANDPRQAPQLTGLALRGDATYALALRTCTRIPAKLQTPSPSDPSNGLVCYQSVWVYPIGLDRPSPPVPKAIPKPVDERDLDQTLWIPENADTDTSSLNKPPSDDATAKGPDGVPPLIFDQSSGLDASILTPGVLLNNNRSRKSSGRLAILITVVSITVLLLGLGLLCLLLILYRRRKRSDRAIQTVTKYSQYATWPHDSTLGSGTDRRRPNRKFWSRRCTPAYSALLSWVNPRKHSPKRHVPGTVSLVEVHGPPPGTMTSHMDSYSAGFPPGYCDDLTGPQDRLRQNGTYDGSLDGLVGGVATNFGSLRAEAIRNEANKLRSMDSPNSTLYANDPRAGLSRVDSASLGHRGLLMNSPSPTTVFPGNFAGRLGYPDSLPGCNGFSAGSLKSVTTLGSRSMQPALKTLGVINLPNGQVCGSRLIGINQLMETVQTLKADSGRLMAAEFESIDPGGQFSWEHSNRPANRPKNRYANVIAYDHSRVVLQPTSPTDPDSDYINANYLDGYRKQNAYIATQGPLPHTVIDFWRMVWEQRSAMIVSMTRLEERARIKCEQYWPGCIGPLSVNLASTVSPASRIGQSRMTEPKLWSKDQSVPPPVMFRGPGYVAMGDDSLVFSNEHSNNPLHEDSLGAWNSTNTDVLTEATYGDITVGLLDTMELAYYTMRTFVLHKIGCSERREVRQLQFTAWPDHGVPNHPAPLLMFLRRVRAECPPDVGPIIVHCSAGVGRTGAFILLDILLEQMRHEKAVDVFGAVSRLRAQRNFMVQTEDQYAFVYEALVEAASSGNTELSVRQLAQHWDRLTKPETISTSNNTVLREYTNEDGSCTTGLELEFSQLLTQTQLSKMTQYLSRNNIGLLSPIDPFSGHDDDRFNTGLTSAGPQAATRLAPNEVNTLKPLAALARANLSKNRHLDVVPHDANRVALKAVRGVEGSDYINASYIDGYRTRAAYIATQAPLESTLEDFWRMIWETGSCLIVRLESLPTFNDPKSADSPVYWPTVQSARHGFLVIDPIATYTMNSYVLRELRITDTRDGTTRTIRQFDATTTTEGMIDFENDTLHNYYGHCRAGAKPGLDPGDSDPLAASSSPSQADSLLESSVTGNINRFESRTALGNNFKQRYQSLCEAMLETVIQVHKTKEHFGMEGPITVHCNLGAGRTGVFLTIALVLQRMRYEGVVDMFQTVKLLRWQRPGLVNTAAEYAFCYATALEYLESFERYTT